MEAFNRYGTLIREEALAYLKTADAVLLGAYGTGKEYESVPLQIRRSWGMLRLREEMQVVANLRPIRAYPQLASISPLRPEVTLDVDLILVRELTAGLYIDGPRGIEMVGHGERRAVNTQTYTTSMIQRVAHLAFELAQGRKQHVTSVDNANVMET